MAHSRVLSIEPFEAALRENTPLTSIGEPKAFTEYLNQTALKSDMVMEELKRVTGEREDYKKKMEEAQKTTKEALDEVTGLKKEKQEKPEAGANKGSDGTEETSEEFFSFDNEVPRLEGELKEKQEEVDNLKTEVEKLKRDMSVTRESTEGMVQNLETATRELVELRETKDKLDAEIETLKTSNKADKANVDDLKVKLATAETSIESTTTEVEKLKSLLKEKSEEVEKLQNLASEKAEPDSELVSQLETTKEEKKAGEKKLVVLQGLVDGLRSQLKETESTVSDLKTEIGQKSEISTKLQQIVDFVDENLKDNTTWQSAKEKLSAGEKADFDEIRKSLAPAKEDEPAPTASTPAPLKRRPSLLQQLLEPVAVVERRRTKRRRRAARLRNRPSQPRQSL